MTKVDCQDRATAGSPQVERVGRKVARVFIVDGVEAVKLPKGFRFDTDQVAILRDGCNLILSPLFEDWEDYFENAARPTDDFGATIDEMPRPTQ